MMLIYQFKILVGFSVFYDSTATYLLELFAEIIFVPNCKMCG
jgi:hypothetical protein